MDLIDQLKQFSKRVEKIKEQIPTEEATKTSIIMPFFQLLGYDVFNPDEFLPEFTADVGIKKGEKVDYAIIQNGNPTILIEAKWIGEKLDKHDSQLFRYFSTTTAKFAILTNGIIYRFYTDLDEQNKMDEKPFLEINILDIKESYVPELKKFHKSNFDVDTILSSASELKYSNEIKNFLTQQMQSPTDPFINYIVGEIYSGRKTQNVIEKFRDIVKKSMHQFVNELINEKIKTMLEVQTTETEVAAAAPAVEETKNENPPSQIVTTEEELEGFFIVKNILKSIVDVEHITYKDTVNYFGILYQGNTKKWICRLFFNSSQKYIVLPDENKAPVKYLINSIDEINNYSNELINIVKRYL